MVHLGKEPGSRREFSVLSLAVSRCRQDWHYDEVSGERSWGGAGDGDNNDHLPNKGFMRL